MASPQWETRSQPFVTSTMQQHPAQLEPRRSFDAAANSPQQQQRPSSLSPNSGTTPSRVHTRTSSFFSSLRPKLMSNNSGSSGQQNMRQSMALQNPLNPIDEFGAPRPTQSQGQMQQQQPPPPQQQQFGGPPPADLQPPPPTVQRRPSQAPAQQPGQPLPLHAEIRSVVQLQLAHAHKIYFSGPLIKRVERLPDGQRPVKEEGWVDVWAQLGGTTLSVWDMNEINEASKEGREVPPSYINVTDSFIQVLGSVTIPGSPTVPQKKYMNVITLNTAGANLILFSCPDTASLISWAAALRLSGWEKSRLEEIYTAHILRLSYSEDGQWREPPTKLVRGKFEGACKIRIAGKTDWRPVFIAINGTIGNPGSEDGRPTSPTGQGSIGSGTQKKRMSKLLSRTSSNDGTQGQHQPAAITLYASNKGKDRKRPLLTIRNITQAFAVYPERPELINASTLIKIEGLIGEEEAAGAMKNREGWLFIMPEVESGKLGSKEMLRWVTAIHDAFGLYGRDPQRNGYTWDPRDPVSLMFSYPVGPLRERLFLDRELAEPLDPRDDRTSAIRSRFTSICLDRMRSGPPAQVPNPSNESETSDTAPRSSPSPPGQETERGQNNAGLPQLPPLNFSGAGNAAPQPPTVQKPSAQRNASVLTPITERTTVDSTQEWPNGSMGSTSRETMPAARRTGTDSSVLPPAITTRSASSQTVPKAPGDEDRDGVLVIGRTFSSSPVSDSEPPLPTPRALSHEGATAYPDHPYKAFASSTAPAQTSPKSQGSNKDIRSSISTIPGRPSMELNESRLSPSAVVQSPNDTSPSTAQSPRFSYTNRARSPSGHSTGSVGSGNIPPAKSPPTSALPALPGDTTFKPPPPPHPTTPPPSGIRTPMRNTPPIASSSVSPQGPLLPQLNGIHKPELGVVNTVPPTDAVASMRPSDLPSGSNYNTASTSRHQTLGAYVANPSHSEPPSDGEDGKNDRYHEEPRNVAVSAISPSPRKRTSTPMVFDAPPPPAETSQPPPQQEQPSPISNRVPANADVRKAGLGRRPSGARAAPAKRAVVSETHKDLSPVQDSEGAEHMAESQNVDDSSTDALVALSFLQQSEHEPAPAPRRGPRFEHSPSPPLEDTDALQPSQQAPTEYRSSFAPSKQAAERKARSQAAQAASHAAVSKPGRPNGGAKIKKDRGAWESSEEEDEEEDEEDEEEASDEDGVAPGLGPARNQPQNSMQGAPGSMTDLHAGAHPRPPRLLPALPGQRPPEQQSMLMGRKPYPDADASHRQPREEDPRNRQTHSQERHHPEYAQPPAQRQTMWSSVLDANKNPSSFSNARDTFVNLDEDSHTMTKAFQPQGLLSAGLQDKEDRSARRQEEMAREAGASLINVPSKPPPPQTGLLGAITGYERDRKREGGVGAALTERERERRLAEDRQRKLDDFQKQQLDQHQQMQQQGMGTYSMYGGQSPMSQYGNPMMANPMMMSGYFNPMMGGFNNPQHFFAAQQAAQAYQQAMMSFSQAGSQVGDNSGAPSPQGQSQQLPPLQQDPTGHLSPGMMTPQMGMGFDPRMSMMGMGGMGMMSPMGMGFDPRMSMYSPGPMDFNQMQGMGMQNTGMQNTGMPNTGMPGAPMQPPYGNPSRSPSGDPPNGPGRGRDTPPSRGSGNASPRPPLPPPPPPTS